MGMPPARNKSILFSAQLPQRQKYSSLHWRAESPRRRPVRMYENGLPQSGLAHCETITRSYTLIDSTFATLSSVGSVVGEHRALGVGQDAVGHRLTKMLGDIHPATHAQPDKVGVDAVRVGKNGFRRFP